MEKRIIVLNVPHITVVEIKKEFEKRFIKTGYSKIIEAPQNGPFPRIEHIEKFPVFIETEQLIDRVLIQSYVDKYQRTDFDFIFNKDNPIPYLHRERVPLPKNVGLYQFIKLTGAVNFLGKRYEPNPA